MNLPPLVYKSPRPFTLRQRIALVLVPPIVAVAVRALMASCRWEFRDPERLGEALAQYGAAILGVWHESIAFAAWRYRSSSYHTLTSFSYDGEMAARVARQFGLRAVRGSSSKGGLAAVYQLEAALDVSPVIGLTLDGPRGPHRVAKAGAAIVAARKQVPILPHAFAAQKAWRLNSWDRFPIPKPFSRIVSAYGKLIPPPADRSRNAIQETRVAVENELNRLHEELERELA